MIDVIVYLLIDRLNSIDKYMQSNSNHGCCFIALALIGKLYETRCSIKLNVVITDYRLLKLI